MNNNKFRNAAGYLKEAYYHVGGWENNNTERTDNNKTKEQIGGFATEMCSGAELGGGHYKEAHYHLDGVGKVESDE